MRQYDVMVRLPVLVSYWNGAQFSRSKAGTVSASLFFLDAFPTRVVEADALRSGVRHVGRHHALCSDAPVERIDVSAASFARVVLLETLGRVKQQFATMGERRRFWEKLFVNDRLAQSLANNDQKAITETTEQLINEPLDHRGEVVLVGAGPGDAGLLTLKGLQQIQQADVVVYDRLVSDDIMNLVRRDADRVFVGKRAGYHCVPQEEINQILLREAQKGKRVVRLKGGDPFIFGRGGEELETLCNAGIPFSVVPGITAASGCSAYSGIPLTHRDYAQSVRLITGHLKTGGELDWENLAAEKQTLVFYMGLNQAATIQQKLIEHGMPGEMPVAIVENGTAVTQRVIDGTLTQLGELAQQMNSPSLIIIGRVVGLRDKLNWFSNH